MNYIQAAGVILYNQAPTQKEIDAILSSPHATQSLLEDKTTLPEGDYYSAYDFKGTFLGLIWSQQVLDYNVRAIHPMLLESSKSLAVHITELAIQYTLLQNLQAVATVSDTIEYRYIQNFIAKRITPHYTIHTNEKGQQVRVYYLKQGWQPLSFDSFFCKRSIP